MVENIGILILSLFAEFLAISVAGGDQVFLCPFNLSGYRSEPYLVQQEQHRLVNGDLCGLQKMSDSNLHDDLVDFDLSESYVNSVMLSQTVLNTPVSVMSSQTVLNTPTSGTYGRNGNNGTRKRHLSMPPVYDTVKKLRGAGSINSDLVVGGEREGIEIAESLAQDQNQGNTGQKQNHGNKTENPVPNCGTRKLVTAKKKLYKAQNHSEVICTAANVHGDADMSVKEMISQMNT